MSGKVKKLLMIKLHSKINETEINVQLRFFLNPDARKANQYNECFFKRRAHDNVEDLHISTMCFSRRLRNEDSITLTRNFFYTSLSVLPAVSVWIERKISLYLFSHLAQHFNCRCASISEATIKPFGLNILSL